MSEPIAVGAVANEFLDLQDQEPAGAVFPKIDPMKLQKLLFYAQAWWLAIKDRGPLYREEIYAWPWGPVIPPIYHEFKHFGAHPIVGARSTELVRTGPGLLNYKVKTPERPSQEIQTFLQDVWNSHRAYTGVQLSNATHAAGEPWTIVKDEYGTLNSTPLIPNDLIKAVFKAKIIH